MGLSFSRKTQFQDKLILKCNSKGFFPKSIKILQILSFNRMEHYHIGIVMFQVF